MGVHFLAKGVTIVIPSSLFGLPGILIRLPPFERMQHAGKNRPWLPRAGDQDDGSYTNAFKYQILCDSPNVYDLYVILYEYNL